MSPLSLSILSISHKTYDIFGNLATETRRSSDQTEILGQYPTLRTSTKLQNLYSVFSTDSREGVADALLAVGGGEDVVDAGLDLLDRVQVAAVRHRL